MDKYSKNSLLGQLKESGIITSSEDESSQQGFLPFGILTGAMEQSPFVPIENPIQKDDVIEPVRENTKKRLNELDGNFFNQTEYLNGDNVEFLEEENEKKSIENINSKINFREKVKELEKIIFKICPKLHKNYLVRKALKRLIMLNENAKELMSKKIPYGESESRYSDFTAYLSSANLIHAKLTKKI